MFDQYTTDHDAYDTVQDMTDADDQLIIEDLMQYVDVDA